MNNILNGNPMPVEERRRLQCDVNKINKLEPLLILNIRS